jgi:protein O-GlcNAc transferase
MGIADWLRRGKTSDEARERATRLIERGNTFEDAGDAAAACDCYRQATGLAPDFARAYLNLGNGLQILGDVEGALRAISKAASLEPDLAIAHYNMGNLHAEQQRTETAVDCYRRALHLDPELTDAAIALGNALGELGRMKEAVAAFASVAARRPDHIELRLNLAGALMEQADWPGAMAHLRDALARAPDNAKAAALACMCAGHLCDWEDREAIVTQVRHLAENGSGIIPPFNLLTLDLPGTVAPLLHLQAARDYARRQVGTPAPVAAVAGKKLSGGRLRIGYLSADIHDHATMHLLLGVFCSHDHERFAVHCYSYGHLRDATTERVERASDLFRDLSAVSDREAAQLIAEDGIDVLIDLKGYTLRGRPRIQSFRPAPVIVSWLGYPGSLGDPSLADYLIGDPVVTPLEDASHYSETLALMPHCYQPNDSQRPIGPKPTREALGLPPSGTVFCSFNQNYKLTPATMDSWCAILRNVPDGVLWLLAASEATRANLRKEARKRGVSEDRLIFCVPVDQKAHLGRLQQADLALDTFPYTSHTTASDALWVGVPVPTRIGSSFASRVAASLLRAAGVPELVTGGEQEYVELVTALAIDGARLAAVKQSLVRQRETSPLFDSRRFARDLERLYDTIWQQHCAGLRSPIILQ